MQTYRSESNGLAPVTREFYPDALRTLNRANIPFLVCGSYALEVHTGIGRKDRDLDVFVCQADCDHALSALAAAGYSTETVFSHWLAKARDGDLFLDVIFSSGNGVCRVDRSWFDHAADGSILGIPVKLCAPEEMIWQQAFVMERERFDGGDVAHLIRARGVQLDWPRLLERFGAHWRVLLAHVILFDFIYPTQRALIPDSVYKSLLGRLDEEESEDVYPEPLCRGTLLSRAQYLADVERWGYRDARLGPRGNLTPEQVRAWTAPIRDNAATVG